MSTKNLDNDLKTFIVTGRRLLTTLDAEFKPFYKQLDRSSLLDLPPNQMEALLKLKADDLWDDNAYFFKNVPNRLGRLPKGSTRKFINALKDALKELLAEYPPSKKPFVKLKKRKPFRITLG